MGQGRLLGIARRARVHAPMETLDHAEVTVGHGVGCDARGVVRPGGRGRRQVTVVAREAWDAVCAELGRTLPWSLRRANLLVAGLDLAGGTGRRLRIGAVTLLVTGEAEPCAVMDRQLAGLRHALTPGWRGGVTCKVLTGGRIALDDPVRMEA